MKKIIAAATFLSCSLVTFCQEKVDLGMMQKIKDEEKNNSQISMIAHNITDVCGPRLTNSPGYKRAHRRTFLVLSDHLYRVSPVCRSDVKPNRSRRAKPMNPILTQPE
jgi:hypothetical protein